MCLFIYLASNKPLDLVNKVERETGFYLRNLNENENSAYQNFTKRFVYFVASWEGCSCGFLMDGIYSDMPEFVEIRETYHLFSKFLQNNLQNNSLEIFVCWAGDEAEKPIKYETLRASEIGETSFSFEEKHFYKIDYI